MFDELEDDDTSGSSGDPKVESINNDLLHLIGEVVKVTVEIAELSPKQLLAVKSRFNALVSAVNALDVEETTPPKMRKN